MPECLHDSIVDRQKVSKDMIHKLCLTLCPDYSVPNYCQTFPCATNLKAVATQLQVQLLPGTAGWFCLATSHPAAMALQLEWESLLNN
jgi:hypothetical protein